MHISVQGVKHAFHYLVDFAVAVSPDSKVCSWDMYKLRAVCVDVPLVPEEQKDSSIYVTEIIIDICSQQLSLLKEKLNQLFESLDQYIFAGHVGGGH